MTINVGTDAQLLKRLARVIGTNYYNAGSGSERAGILEGMFTTLRSLGIKHNDHELRLAIHDVDNELWEANEIRRRS